MESEVKNHVLSLFIPFPNLFFFPPGAHLSFLGVEPCMVLMGSGYGVFESLFMKPVSSGALESYLAFFTV